MNREKPRKPKSQRRSRGFTLKPGQTLDILPLEKSKMRLTYHPQHFKVRVVKRD